MVKVVFKNVGQGDSIILEWVSQEIPKIAIIDCNLYEGTNPVLKHIIACGIKEIEFIILSHPHLDHFSGFVELLNYCRANGIVIHKFLHTALITPDYLKTASRSIEGDRQLSKLFTLLKEMRNNGQLNVYAIDDNPLLKIPLGDEFNMQVLAPSAIETDKYIKGVSYPFDEEESTGNPNANWLSTVLKIYNNDASVILTSDVEASVLSRIGKRKGGKIGNNKILLAQVPHHGSKGNLNKTFWQMRKRHPITPVTISVGENGYNHPSIDVVNFFNGLPNYKLERTDDYKVISTKSEKVLKISSLLDMVSKEKTKVPEDYSKGDKIFILTGSKFTTE